MKIYPDEASALAAIHEDRHVRRMRNSGMFKEYEAIIRRLDELNTVFDISGEVTSAAESQMTEAYNQVPQLEQKYHS